MSQLTLIATPDEPDRGSPFDAIRRFWPDGAEYWLARELMPLLGYAKWQDFANATERARAACRNTGADPASHFMDIHKINDLGYRQADVNLTRFGAYLVAMNGDPGKQEIAEAQAYFAIKTREAELRPALPTSYAEALRALAGEVERREGLTLERDALSVAVQIAAPQVGAFKRLMDAEGTCSLAEAAQTIGTGQNRLCEFLRARGVLIAAAGQRFNTPYQKHLDVGRFSVRAGTRESSEGELVATYTTRVTTKGLEYIRSLWDNRKV